MKYTQEAIYNLALNHLGVSAIVQNTADKNPRVTVLNNFYSLAKEETAKAFDWNFLNRVAELTPSSEKCPDPRFVYAYDYPNDCISARYILLENNEKYKKFDVTTDSKGNKIIVCNQSPAYLVYTRLLNVAVPETFFTAEYVSALSWYLAFLCAIPIVGNAQTEQKCYQGYQMAIARAKAMNATESINEDQDDSTYLDSRN